MNWTPEMLRQRLDSGNLSLQRLRFAAALGSDAAAAAGIDPAPLAPHYRSRIEAITAEVPARLAVLFACECAERCLPAWESLFPEDHRPRKAVAAARTCLDLGHGGQHLAELGKDASAAGIAADHPDDPDNLSTARVAAIEAAHGASHAALAAEVLSQGDESKVPEVTAWVARFALRASSNPEEEEKCQARRLVELLLSADG